MFSIGVAEPRTHEERRRYLTAHPSVLRRPPAFTSRGWNLLPLEAFINKGLYFSMSFDYATFAQLYTHFMQYRLWIGKPLGHQEQYNEIQTEAKEKFFLNQKLRFQFKRIVSMYLLKKLHLKNEKDPVTMEPPRQAVFLYDHVNRCKFRFEAKELLRDFSTRLLTHDDLFPSPLFLRNPFTNTRLHIGQVISLYTQIKSFGYMHWTLECFQDAQFILSLFLRDTMRKLRLSALRNYMQSPQGYDFLLDFIEAQHETVNKPFDFRTYTWAVSNCDSIERICSWKRMCYTFYEIEITEEDILERQRKTRKLLPVLLNLCSPCHEIRMLRKK